MILEILIPILVAAAIGYVTGAWATKRGSQAEYEELQRLRALRDQYLEYDKEFQLWKDAHRGFIFPESWPTTVQHVQEQMRVQQAVAGRILPLPKSRRESS